MYGEGCLIAGDVGAAQERVDGHGAKLQNKKVADISSNLGVIFICIDETNKINVIAIDPASLCPTIAAWIMWCT